MNPYYVLPVWSFDGPSRHDGVCVGSLCEPLLACHSIRFSRFKLQRIPLTTCGFPCCVPPVVCSAARRYITHSPWPCQQVVGALFRRLITELVSPDQGCKKRLPIVSGGRQQSSVSTASLRLLGCLWTHLRTAFRFQHALRSAGGSGGAVSYCTRLQIRVQGISPISSNLPSTDAEQSSRHGIRRRVSEDGWRRLSPPKQASRTDASLPEPHENQRGRVARCTRPL